MNIRHLFYSGFSLLVGFFILSCATTSILTGKKFDVGAADQIIVRKTTEEDVIRLLGAPLNKKVNFNGTKIYGYGYIEKTTFGKAKYSGAEVEITFDKNGIVTSLDRQER